MFGIAGIVYGHTKWQPWSKVYTLFGARDKNYVQFVCIVKGCTEELIV